MARERRMDSSGYYHLSNRGVGLREVFLSNEDRILFITLMSNAAKQYDFVVHGYALLSNGYNLLIETSKNNLSHIMKHINGYYTAYFNRQYRRRGHLWEGRFKSWHLPDDGFVLDILAYIEHLPLYTGIATDKQHYFYASYRQFIGIDERLPCLTNSVIFKRFNTLMEIKSFFAAPVDIERINRIHQLLKNESKKRLVRPKKTLEPLELSHFHAESKEEKYQKIYEAYKNGHSQAKIGMVLDVSQQAIYKIVKKLSV